VVEIKIIPTHDSASLTSYNP